MSLIQIFTAKYRSARPILAGAIALTLALSACSSKDEDPEEIEPGAADCERDEQNEPANAVPLTSDAASGFICPKDDQDWYSLSIPSSDQLVSVNLGMTVPLSPVDITYAIFSLDEAGEPDTAVAQPPSGEIDVGVQLDISHCIDPGEYMMVVRDQGDDGSDFRNQYALSVTTAPDPDMSEPNESLEEAQAISQSVTGYIACRGDEDWFSIQVPEQNRLVVRLTSPISNYQPRVRIIDANGDVITDAENKASATTATDIDLTQVLPGAGTYYVAVTDDDGEDADPSVPYQLEVEGVTDIDPNEPNDSPETATPVTNTPVACDATPAEFTFQGSFGSPGDNDWFRVPLTGCQNGVVEAQVELDTAGLSAEQQWELAGEVQASVTLVRPHAPSACAEDTDCNTLQISCDEPLDCAGYFETCLGQGLCAGSTACLPEGMCGANQMQRRYGCPATSAECRPGSGTPPPNQARLAAPTFGDDFVYLRVNDFQSNGAAPDRLYNLRVRVYGDPDTNEPNNPPLNEISPTYSRSALSSNPEPIAVKDCTAGDCCNGGEVTGVISYDSDVDWYRFPHPCPGEDCTLRMVWSTEAGPTDIAINVYRNGGGQWRPAREPDQQDMQAADSGSVGGAAMNANGCFYAYQSHDPAGYLVEVRDRFSLLSDDVNVDPQSRDWSVDQSYSFCVEKVSNVCEEPPCQIYTDGCGPPQ